MSQNVKPAAHFSHACSHSTNGVTQGRRTCPELNLWSLLVGWLVRLVHLSRFLPSVGTFLQACTKPHTSRHSSCGPEPDLSISPTVRNIPPYTLQTHCQLSVENNTRWSIAVYQREDKSWITLICGYLNTIFLKRRLDSLCCVVR